MKRTIGLVMANYSGTSFGTLTEERPAASLPFGGRYRMIDFPLSNMTNSGISTVGLITPYMYRSLMDHVGVGKEWSLNRKVGGMFILPGSIYGLKNMQGKFLLRDILQNSAYFLREDADLVAITSCNKIMNMDFRQVIREHEENSAEITLVYKNGMVSNAPENFCLELAEGGRVTGLRAARGKEGNLFLDAMIMDISLLNNIANWYSALGYMDLMDIIVENLDKIRVRGYEYTGYVGLVDDTSTYMKTNMELLQEDVRTALFHQENPILTKVQDSAPTKYTPDASVKNSFISSGCMIEGSIENSIIFRGVKIHKGAKIRNCIIMQKTVIGENAELDNVIIDKYVTVKPGVHVLAGKEKPIIVGKKQEI